MWSVHVVPNNGTSCLALEEQYQTHVMVRQKHARGRGVMPDTFEAKMRPLMNVMKNKLFSDHFFFQAVVFVYFRAYIAYLTAWNRFCRKHVIIFDRQNILFCK